MLYNSSHARKLQVHRCNYTAFEQIGITTDPSGGPATGVSRARRARVFRGVSPRVSPKTGVSDAVSQGVSPRALLAPGSGVSIKCSESVPRVSGHSGDTLGTLFGHSGARSPKSLGHPVGHSVGVAGRRDRKPNHGPNAFPAQMRVATPVT